MRRFRWALLALALFPLVSCGGRGAHQVLEATTSNLAEVKSGDLRLAMMASAGASGEERPVGFEVTGSFAEAAAAGELPVARLRRTRVVGGPLEPTTFVSTGKRAFLEVGGTAYEIPESQVQSLRARDVPEKSAGGLQRLDLAGWARAPEMTDGGQVDGAPVQRVAGRVDVARALSDILAVANQVGAAPDEGLRPIDGDGARRLERVVRSSHLEVFTGKEDRLLRRLRLDVTFAAAAADLQDLEVALGPLAGSRLHLEMELSGFNRKVDVQAPLGARPLSELRGRP